MGERIAHRLLTAGLISVVLGTRLPGPGSIHLSQSPTLLKPAKIGDTISASVKVSNYSTVKRSVTLEANRHNRDSTEVLSGGAVLLEERR